MQLVLKNKDTLLFGEFKFKCAVGKKGITSNKVEGDKKTPRGIFSLGSLFYRKDRISKLDTRLKRIPIRKTMGWCDDIESKQYNKRILIKKILNMKNCLEKIKYTIYYYL